MEIKNIVDKYKKLQSEVSIYKKRNDEQREVIKEMTKKIKSQKDQLDDTNNRLAMFENGFKGACPSCERVGEMNVKLKKKLDEAIEVIKFYGEPNSSYTRGLKTYTKYKDDTSTINDCGYTLKLVGKKAREFLEKFGYIALNRSD